MSEVPIRSLRVPAVLVGAALLGIGIGTWLGRVGSAAPVPSSAIGSPGSTAVIATPTLAPSRTPTASPAPSPPGLVLRQEGTTDATTATFDVEPGWRITWRTDGESFAYAVTGDQNLGTIVDKKGPASGVTSLSLGGSFRIEIKAVGPWSIVVVNGEEPNPSPT
jgi:hypothetical protein